MVTTKSGRIRKGNGLLGVCLSVASLYFAREVLIPIALAVLFAFLLEPLAHYFEKHHLGRVGSALAAVLLSLLILGALSYFVLGQFSALGGELPRYEKNIHDKLRRFQATEGALNHAVNSLQDFKKDLTPTNSASSTNNPRGKAASPPEAKVVPVEVRNPESSTLQLVRGLVGPSLNFVVTLFLVTVFCVFTLVGRDDLRARLIRIVGSRNERITDKLLDEMGTRVSRYLLMQLIVNVTYGIPIGFGLWLIGIPNPLFWGMMASLFRYIPYAGPWLAASMPIAVAIAIGSSWSQPVLVLALFAVIEILTANLVEPRLYGNSTGITPLAVLLAAVFWTWVWGPIGLLLSMPLTVCLVSIARYAPQLEILDQLFGETKSETRSS